MSNPKFTKNYAAGGAIHPFRICKWDTVDFQALEAAAATDAMFGISAELGPLGVTASGDRLDVHRSGIVPCDYGGTVTRGDPLTSDGSGKAIKATAAAGANVNLIGYAEVSGVSGDRGLVFISPSVMQG